MSIQKSIKNALLTANGLVAFSTNQPTAYADKQPQIFSPETKTFTQQYARYSSTYFEAKVQGIDPKNPFAWQTRMIRMADIVRPSAALLRKADNYKMILFADREIEYITPGAKIETMGSVWLVTNPFNISAADGGSVAERCNAVWNYLDYYGNVVSEPMVVTNVRADANDSDAQEGNLITKGYFNVTMQYNAATAQIDTNTRFILGTAAYRVTGYSDFMQEFTGDYETVRLLNFTVRYEEPNVTIDDMENHVAGGKAFSWDVSIAGLNRIAPEGTAQLTASSSRNGEPVQGSEEQPVSYLWSSGNEAVAAVDENGLVTGVSEGWTIITATLAQNPRYSANYLVSVEAVSNAVRFTSSVPESLQAYGRCKISAAYFADGAETDEALEWSFSGAAEGSYRATGGGKQVRIYCFGYSETPLQVTVRYNDLTAVAAIALGGL